MRDYLYISDAKLDMLFPQVPGATQQKVAREFGFDVKVFSASIGTEEQTFDSRTARLLAVEDHIRATNQLGGPWSASPWIAGEFEAKIIDIGDGAVLFVAHDNGDFVALGGSMGHVRGGRPTERVSLPLSFRGGLTNQLLVFAEAKLEWALAMSEEALEQTLSSGVGQRFDAWMSIISEAWLCAREPIETIEFLARRFVTKATRDGARYTLGTPVFVALQ